MWPQECERAVKNAKSKREHPELLLYFGGCYILIFLTGNAEYIIYSCILQYGNGKNDKGSNRIGQSGKFFLMHYFSSPWNDSEIVTPSLVGQRDSKRLNRLAKTANTARE